jgi:hypothetical protein
MKINIFEIAVSFVLLVFCSMFSFASLIFLDVDAALQLLVYLFDLDFGKSCPSPRVRSQHV